MAGCIIKTFEVNSSVHLGSVLSIKYKLCLKKELPHFIDALIV